MKIRLVGSELFHADGWTGRQTDMAKLILASPNFANAPRRRQLTVLTYCFTPNKETVSLSETLAPVG